MAKLPILMYHVVTENKANSQGLIISKERLETQFNFLNSQGYKSFHLDALHSLNSADKLPKKSVVITFDDVYANQLELVLPLLKKYNLKATFFVPFKYVSGHDDWNEGAHPLMSLEQLKHLDSNFVQLGWHSYAHLNYGQISDNELRKDLKSCKDFIEDNDLDVKPYLAYPYGKFPRKSPDRQKFEDSLIEYGIVYGLRIGNRLNSFPFKDPFAIQRLDIKGEDTLTKFKLKLKLGKLKLF